MAHLVTLPSGATLPVLTEAEADYLTDRVERYTSDNSFVNISDHQDVDRVLVMELLCHRWGTWLAQGHDYTGDPQIDEAILTRDLEKYNLRISALKKTIGLDKSSRDRTKGEGSVAHYWASLLERAKHFGVMRNKQSAKSIELFMQLFGHVTTHLNANPEERRELKVTAEDIIDWIDKIARPEIEEIDRSFRQDGPNAQAIWIRSQ